MQDGLALLSRDPFLFYTLAAALLLLSISLLQGWLKGDLLAILAAQGLFHLTLAVLAAFVLTLAQRALGLGALALLPRLPLYLIALAYGPSAGAAAALLYAAFGSDGALGYPELLLLLELSVIGWLAIAPSPFHHRWAGPLNVAVGYALTWATAGAAYLDHLTGQGLNWRLHAAHHSGLGWGLALCLAALLLISPARYRRQFADSRLHPDWQPLIGYRRGRRALAEPQLPKLSRGTRRRHRRLPTPKQALWRDDEN